MKNNNDFEFIKNKFDSDGIKTPDSIGKDAAMKMISNAEQTKQKPKLYKKIIPVISAAACVAIAITAVLNAAPERISANNVMQCNIESFGSYDEVAQKVKEMRLEERKQVQKSADKLDTASASSNEDSASSVYSKTYTQTEGVDEADIIKNDGIYIYYAYTNDTNFKVSIYKGTKKISAVNFAAEKENESESICDMYVDGATLVVNTNIYSYDESSDNLADSYDYAADDYAAEGTCKTYIYNLENIKKPELKGTFSQDGSYVSSRKIGNTLYVVSEKNLYYDDDKTTDCTIKTAKNGKESTLSASDIKYTAGSSDCAYVILSSINTEKSDYADKTKAVFGCTDEVYCSENALYTIGCDGNAKTNIIKTELKNGKTKISASTKITGIANDQYSVDEKDGYLRIAVTSDGKGNKLYVLDSDLKKIGETEYFEKNESIQAVYFVDDFAYVITYEQTDPLFVIDLSNPKAPKIKGSVEITGYSSELVPVGENMMLGFGYGENYEDLKIALFDVSDASNPKILDSKTLKNTESNAQSTHKAVAINKKDGYSAIDFVKYSKNYDLLYSGALTVKITDKKIEITNTFKSDKPATESCRCTIMGGSVYVLDDYGNISAFEVKN